jgi:hypothetical protein
MSRNPEPSGQHPALGGPDHWQEPNPGNSPELEVDVTTDGRFESETEHYARTRIEAAASSCARSIHRAEVRIIRYPDPLLPQPVVARANLNVEGHLLQAHALGTDVRRTIDDLHDAVCGALNESDRTQRSYRRSEH